MSPSRSVLSPNAIGWALLSQVVWVPLVAIDLHDRWQAHQRQITPPGRSVPPSPIARARPFSLNDLLGATRPVQELASQANQAVSGAVGQAVNGAGVLLSTAGSGMSSLLDRPFSASVEAPSSRAGAAAGVSTGAPLLALATASGTAPTALSLAGSTSSLLSRGFTRAQLLGGEMGLGDLNEGPMTPLALVERALQASSGDPLAPLPALWREPMRQALQKLPGSPQRLGLARMVFVPSSRVSQPTEVPLALQSDGSVDVLSPPADPAVLNEIDGWSRRQRPPAVGSLVPAVVHLHPLSEPAVVSPSATVRSAAPTSAPAPAGSPAATRSGSPSLPPFLQTSRTAPPASAAPAPAAVASPPADASASRIPADLPPPPPLPQVAEAAPIVDSPMDAAAAASTP